MMMMTSSSSSSRLKAQQGAVKAPQLLPMLLQLLLLPILLQLLPAVALHTPRVDGELQGLAAATLLQILLLQGLAAAATRQTLLLLLLLAGLAAAVLQAGVQLVRLAAAVLLGYRLQALRLASKCQQCSRAGRHPCQASS
jgi:hypothetical protein